MTDSTITARQRYVEAWNTTMIQIWRERLLMFDAYRTGALYRSLTALPVRADGRFTELTLSQTFLPYGIYVDRGVGKEFRKGNPGDVAVVQRKKHGGHTYRGQREIRPWFTASYWRSVRNLQDFFSDSLGDEFRALMTNL